MSTETHVMALLSSAHGAILFFAGCFFGMRWAKSLLTKPEPTPPVVDATVKGA